MAKSAYGWEYQKARKRLLASNPMCHWGCGRPATTADHVPPVAEVGPHLNLVPACGKCNFGHRQQDVDLAGTPSRQW